jgi:hypothetical protein
MDSPLKKLIFTHIYVESDYDQMLQHVIPAKAGIQRLANISYVYIEDLYDELIGKLDSSLRWNDTV